MHRFPTPRAADKKHNNKLPDVVLGAGDVEGEGVAAVVPLATMVLISLTGGTIGFVEAAGWESFSPWTTMGVVSLVSWVAIVLADVALVRSSTF